MVCLETFLTFSGGLVSSLVNLKILVYFGALPSPYFICAPSTKRASVLHSTQWGENDGNCGVCGDNYVDPRPRANENTGTYGQGRVVRTYTSGSVIQTGVVLTANHLGSFHYSLCVLDDPNAPESGEECFQPLRLADGSKQYNVSKPDKAVTNQVQLPDGLTCERCVLRWHYRTGNGWGFCEDGTGAIGCGPQETFRSCADIAIL